MTEKKSKSKKGKSKKGKSKTTNPSNRKGDG